MKTRSILGLVAGVLLVASSGAHAFLGWPALRAALEEVNAGRDLALDLGAGWLFGSVAMLAFGAIVITRSIGVLRGESPSPTPQLVVGAAYVAFGAGAIAVYPGINAHFVGFVVLGILVLLPLVPSPRVR